MSGGYWWAEQGIDEQARSPGLAAILMGRSSGPAPSDPDPLDLSDPDVLGRVADPDDMYVYYDPTYAEDTYTERPIEHLRVLVTPIQAVGLDLEVTSISQSQEIKVTEVVTEIM